MRTITGDLITLAESGHFDAVVHGCNCLCKMGAGLAAQIAARWPAACEADAATTQGAASKLGSWSMVRMSNGTHTWDVLNAYTQYAYSRDRDMVCRQAVESIFQRLRAEYSGRRVGFPRIGAGLGGAPWPELAAIIEPIIEQETAFTLVVLPWEA